MFTSSLSRNVIRSVVITSGAMLATHSYSTSNVYCKTTSTNEQLDQILSVSYLFIILLSFFISI